jgi:hypothetical protein
MTTSEQVQIEGVVKATITLVGEKLKAKWGSLRDCCTDANEMIYDALKNGVELETEFFIPTIERIQGVAIVNGEELSHEWIRIDGTDYDATADQFGDKIEYCGKVIEW